MVRAFDKTVRKEIVLKPLSVLNQYLMPYFNKSLQTKQAFLELTTYCEIEMPVFLM